MMGSLKIPFHNDLADEDFKPKNLEKIEKKILTQGSGFSQSKYIDDFWKSLIGVKANTKCKCLVISKQEFTRIVKEGLN